MSIDGTAGQRPGVPMEKTPEPDPGASWSTPAQQPGGEHHLMREGLDAMTAVFGTAVRPRLASGALRRAAYRIPEHEAKRWMLLLAADRVDVLEHRLPELFTRDSIEALERQVRANPIGMLAAAAGIGFLLQRSGVLQAVAGGVLSYAFTGSENDDPSPREERLLTWLNDAYALEKAQIPILENHADDARAHPHVRRMDLKHLKQTRRHAKTVKRCIERLGARPSISRKAVGRIAGTLNAFSTEPFDDEMTRNFLADFAAENLEIASYRAIVIAAEQAGHADIAEACQRILEEEEAMAEWLEENLPYAVHQGLGTEPA